jgi:uncharacterized protein with NRDE domain
VCLIVLSWDPHAAYPLLLAANRDEFHARPSAPAAFWDDHTHILAGRDLTAGGTWLGVSRRGRIAAVTNVRDPDSGERGTPRSRGDLTRDFLTSKLCCRAYLEAVAGRAGDYQGFNLLISDGAALWYLHGGRAEQLMPRALPAGLYALSNAALDVPWPKVALGRQRMQRAIAEAAPAAPSLQALRGTVADRRLAAPKALAAQGLGGDMAQRLSAQFIVTPQYGTRCCSTLRWRHDGHLEFSEQRFDSAGLVSGESDFALEARAG